MDAQLHHDARNYILEHGTTSDKTRLLAAGMETSEDVRAEVLDEIRASINKDGGIRFNYRVGAPSSVKETAEILTLVAAWPPFEGVSEKMAKFLVTRQKKNGGFAEALNLDPYIEDYWGSSGGRDFYPVGKSVTWLTGKGLGALAVTNGADEDRVRKARDFLLYSQNEDGHWPDYKNQNVSDPLATGNILEGLDLAGVSADHKVVRDGRAALMQHLKGCLDAKSLFDMADLPAIGKPQSDVESNLLRNGLEFIIQSQREDGGWAPMGVKKSDPRLSSILVLVLNRCSVNV